MRRFPILATIVVLLAIAAMVGLGLWQLQRATWKEGLLAQYQLARNAATLEGLPPTDKTEQAAFRRARLACVIATAPVLIQGSSAAGENGFRHIVGCRTSDGRVMTADIGWSGVMARPAAPPAGMRIEGTGLLIPDDALARRIIGTGDGRVPLLIVMERPPTGLAPSVPPSIADIPNNHRSYAVQWFLFAAVAAVIFVLAAWRYRRA